MFDKIKTTAVALLALGTASNAVASVREPVDQLSGLTFSRSMPLLAINNLVQDPSLKVSTFKDRYSEAMAPFHKLAVKSAFVQTLFDGKMTKDQYGPSS